jgi:hypothetical protein
VIVLIIGHSWYSSIFNFQTWSRYTYLFSPHLLCKLLLCRNHLLFTSWICPLLWTFPLRLGSISLFCDFLLIIIDSFVFIIHINLNEFIIKWQFYVLSLLLNLVMYSVLSALSKVIIRINLNYIYINSSSSFPSVTCIVEVSFIVVSFFRISDVWIPQRWPRMVFFLFYLNMNWWLLIIEVPSSFLKYRLWIMSCFCLFISN